MNIRLLSHALCALSLFAFASAVQADTYIWYNYTLDGSNPINDTVIIGKKYLSPDVFNPTITILPGGSISNGAVVYNNSMVNMSGGSAGVFQLYDTSTVNMSNGIIGTQVDVRDNSTFNITGGGIGTRIDAEGGTINIWGGNIGDSALPFNGIVASFNPVINFYGTNLSDTLIDPYYQFGSYSLYSLSGKLSDGTDITGEHLYVWNYQQTNPTINFINTAAVPEPGSVALLLSGMMGAGFAFRRRKPIFSGE